MQKIEDSVISHFESSVDKYSHDPDNLSRFGIQVFEAYTQEDFRVLDIGCGTGYLLHEIQKNSRKLDLYGLDLTPGMVRMAKSIRPTSIRFMAGNSLHLPFADRTFDAVILYSVLHHLIVSPKQNADALRESCLREVRRIVKPGGFIVIQEPCVNTMWRSRLIFLVSYLVSKIYSSSPAVNFFEFNELEALFARCQLTIAQKDVKLFRSFIGWLATLGNFTSHCSYVLKV